MNYGESVGVNEFVRNQYHVFRVVPNSSVSYVRLEADEVVMRYIQPNMEKDRGIGYLKY
jgi:hypothetical protein